ncbi:MAG: phage terminase large subunit [Planctomycetes bacterium]|nr:phage terminase large subunit [Planctomycetota bacterium]
MTPYIPHRPTPKQAAFLLLPSDEALFGGSAGGGKTDALLMAALQYVDVPNYAALILRKTYSDLALPGALMDRSKSWLGGTDATWNETMKTWFFPSGATISFGYLETEADKFRYQGSEFQFIAFDELTQFPESAYRYLFSRLRRLAGVEIPLRMRAASNPGGIGHDWVKSHFIDAKDSGRVFIPSRLNDNPFLDQEQYLRSLEHLDPVTRQQLLEGDWSARSGGSIFRREWFPVTDHPPMAPSIRRVRAWDLAASIRVEAKRTAGLKLSKTSDGFFMVEHVLYGRWTPGDRDRVILETAKADGRSCAVLIEQEPGSGGVAQTQALVKQLAGFNVQGIRPTGDKVVRAGPVASQAQAGNVRLLQGPWVGPFLDELEAFPHGATSDMVDALSLGFNYLHMAPQPRVTVVW